MPQWDRKPTFLTLSVFHCYFSRVCTNTHYLLLAVHSTLFQVLLGNNWSLYSRHLYSGNNSIGLRNNLRILEYIFSTIQFTILSRTKWHKGAFLKHHRKSMIPWNTYKVQYSHYSSVTHGHRHVCVYERETDREIAETERQWEKDLWILEMHPYGSLKW